MALSAQWHVHVLAPNHVLILFAGRAERKTGVLLAELTYGSQLCDFFALGDQIQDARESSAKERSLKARDHDDFASICCHLRKLDYVGKELALVDANDIVRHPLVAKVRKFVDWGGSLLQTAVCADTEVSTVAEIGGKFDSEDLLAGDFVLIAAAEHFGRFSREHATDNELYAAALHELHRLVVQLAGRLAGMDLGGLLVARDVG